MFFRKLTVLLLPLCLCALLVLLFPVIDGWSLGFWADVIKGALLGAAFAALWLATGNYVVRGAFGWLCAVPAFLLLCVLALQYISWNSLASWPFLQLLATRNGQTVLVETAVSTFLWFLALKKRRKD